MLSVDPSDFVFVIVVVIARVGQRAAAGAH
jgi:hypothetical protein